MTDVEGRVTDPAPPPVRRPHVLVRLALFVALLGALIGVVTLLWRFAGLPRPLEHGVLRPVPYLATMAAVSAATVLATALLLRVAEGRSLATLGLPARPGAIAAFAAGCLIGLLPVAATAALATAFGYGSIDPAGGSGAWLGRTLLPLLLGTALISAWEEFLWRGYLLRLFEEWMGRWGAAAATAVLWAAGHLSNQGATPLGLVATAASGVVLAWIVFRTGSLWIAFGYHVAWNVTSMHVLGFTTSGLAEGASLLRTELRGPGWLAGGAYGFEASVVTGILDVGTLSTALWIASRRGYGAGAR